MKFILKAEPQLKKNIELDKLCNHGSNDIKILLIPALQIFPY
jgi:hypothetical protein